VLHDDGSVLAAVDLGSNSFHMVIARVVDGELHIVDRHRERVQLAAGLDEDKRLSQDAQRRSLACLERFGERLRDLPKRQVRAVGTNTLRKAKNARPFLERGRDALGHRIEIISGAEEARLIYLGVAHSFFDAASRRLVIDIGGGSTECILGEGFEPLRASSLYMGCVSFTSEFFPGGKIDRERMAQAENAARLELQTIEEEFRGIGWDACVGASGTILAIREVLRINDWSPAGITHQGLRRLRKELIKNGQTKRLSLAGLPEDRAPVIPGGLAILTATVESLGIEEMRASTGALREGLLHDQLGRIRHEDIRHRTVRRYMERYQVDERQAERVEATALQLLEQVADDWKLPADRGRRFLSWASRLHEIGQAISYSGYHKHGAYLLAHADLPGFSLEGQRMLAAMVLSHRRKFSKAMFAALPSSRAWQGSRFSILLRLAVLLNRGRHDEAPPKTRAKAKKKTLWLYFPDGWLEARPLTRLDLEREQRTLAGAGFRLIVDEIG
jgi:exopolyphosphatase/guanosine-5'-triphosphate,3'-diphosphate pyrophosphatase